MHSLADALTSLREHFGFADFREGQREVITAILEGKDAVVVMPTGRARLFAYRLRPRWLGAATRGGPPQIAL